jgi:hypothetical protein
MSLTNLDTWEPRDKPLSLLRASRAKSGLAGIALLRVKIAKAAETTANFIFG